MGFFDILYNILRVSLWVAIPLAIVAFAGLFSERSGVVNIALEGIMVIGGFFGVFFISIMSENSGLSGNTLFFAGMIVAVLAGTLFAALHAFAAVNMKANQVISGTALNMFAPAFAILVANTMTGFSKITYPANSFFMQSMGFLSDIPVLGPIFFTKTYISIHVGIIIFIVAYIVLYKTRFGLRVRSCGEHPQAADSAGINVYKMRWAGVLTSGALAGLGGLFYIVPITGNYDAAFGVSGYGFLALAVLISGQWKPSRIVIVAFLFGFASRISTMKDLIPALDNLGLTTEMYRIIPYLATLIVLAFTSRNSQGPKAAGEPYDAGKR